jgi:phage FluMu protein Com
MAQLRCTSCDRLFDRPDAASSEFKCPHCGGLALFDWTDGNPDEEGGSRSSRTRRRLGRFLRGEGG